MMQDIDHMKASRVFFLGIGRLDQFEQSKISVLTIASLGIVMLTVYYQLMVSI
jgi:hypothetical protein